MKYNFDKTIDRHGTACLKVDELQNRYGRPDLISLWVADMDFEVCPQITDALKQRLDHRIYGYTAPADSYWQSIIDWERNMHGLTIERNELCYVPGVVKGIALAVNYFTGHDDTIVIQEPVYHPFHLVPMGNKRPLARNLLLKQPDGSYRMDLDDLEKIYDQQKPKMLILCNPHNPGGITWDRQTLCQVAALSKKYGVIVVSDEIHGDLTLFGNEHIPFATVSDDAAEVSITLGAPSKTFNIPGLVSSWCVVKNPKLRDGFFHWMRENEFSEPTFIATIAAETAYKCGSAWLDQLKAYLEGNILTLEDYCEQKLPQIKPLRPQASFLVWLDCTALRLNQRELEDLFINRARLALNSGTIFGASGQGFMRMNIGTQRANIIQALNQLKQAIQEL